MRAYIDSDVLIWHLRGDVNALKFFRRVHNDPDIELWVGAMQRAEVVFFMRPEEDAQTVLFLSQLKTASVDQECVDVAARLYRQWHRSHGVDINDALLAATVLNTGGTIYSLNKKHYPMKELSVMRAW